MLKTVAFLLALLYTIILSVACLIKTDQLPGVGLPNIDKFFHFFTYLVLTYVWFRTFFYTFKFDRKASLKFAAIFSIIFGIVIEVLQGTVTSFRSADVYDVLANTSGVMFSILLIWTSNKVFIKNQ